MAEMKVVLGKKYEDSITGFVGTAVAKTEYFYGCERVGLQPALGENGEVPDLEWFDELQLLNLEPDKKKGGPRPDPVKKKDAG